MTAATASQRVLIIGGAGHAGSAVARMLIERGDHVTAFVRATTDRSKLEGVPYTIIRVGVLIPSNPFHPDADKRSGNSYMTTDLTKFGGVLRVDLNEQIAACIGAERCLNKTFIIDDPTIKLQFDHWICKRANEGPVVSGNVPACGPMPRVTEAQLRGNT